MGASGLVESSPSRYDGGRQNETKKNHVIKKYHKRVIFLKLGKVDPSPRKRISLKKWGQRRQRGI